MLLDIKTRLVLAGAVVGATLLSAAAPQLDTSSGRTTSTENVSPTTHTAPPVTGTLPTPQEPPTDPNANAATGGSGLDTTGHIRGSDLTPATPPVPEDGTRQTPPTDNPPGKRP